MEKKKTKRIIDPLNQSEFITSMAHDLKNPIHGILSYANFGLKKLDSNQLSAEKSHHYYSCIRDAGTRLQSLLNDILDLAKLHSEANLPIKKERNLFSIIQSAVSELLKENLACKPVLEISEPETPIHAAIDAKQMTQALKTVLIAITFLKEESVTLNLSLHESTVECQPIAAIRIICDQLELNREQEDVLLRYLDNLDQTDPNLRKIGLKSAICQKIVAMHGGSVEVVGLPTGGLQVTISLPK